MPDAECYHQKIHTIQPGSPPTFPWICARCPASGVDEWPFLYPRDTYDVLRADRPTKWREWF